ncbi:unnamed protein product [Callosobruchus maculatus]|uniref:Uncharacterized protein n=1 Tax=Callosobruchus maculatus TaxID=64391 RepID=A0A653CI84_CALMS|nr:unnamed protein product [Callosobruchus maculatus]
MSSRAKKIMSMVMDLNSTDSSSIIGVRLKMNKLLNKQEVFTIPDILDIESMPVFLTEDLCIGEQTNNVNCTVLEQWCVDDVEAFGSSSPLNDMMCFEPACDESRAVEDQSNVDGICCDTAGLKVKNFVPYDSSSDDDCDLVTEDYELSSESVVDPNLLDIEVTGDADVLTEQNNNSVRKKQKYADEKNWQRNKNKRLRMKGQKYRGFFKKKGGKIEQNHPRAERKLKARCTSQNVSNLKFDIPRNF